MDSWKKVWREGFLPGLPREGLVALRDALLADDVRLIRGATTDPAPCSLDRPLACEGACAVGFAGWQGLGLVTVGQVQEWFVRQCFACDERLGAPAACRWFLKWFDETPWHDMRRELLKELEHALNQLSAPAPQPASGMPPRGVKRGAGAEGP